MLDLDANGEVPFAVKIQQLAPLAVLVQAMPLWSAKTGINASILTTSSPSVKELSIQFGFSKTPSNDEFDLLIHMLENYSKLLIIQESISALKEAGADSDAINRLVDSADDIAKSV